MILKLKFINAQALQMTLSHKVSDQLGGRPALELYFKDLERFLVSCWEWGNNLRLVNTH